MYWKKEPSIYHITELSRRQGIIFLCWIDEQEDSLNIVSKRKQNLTVVVILEK